MSNTLISQPFRIICEGSADMSFFNSLIRVRGIQNCEADCARLDSDLKRCAGKNAITETLRGLKGYAESQPEKLRGVVVAIDTDEDPKARLAETIDFIKAADLKSPSKYLDIKARKKPEEFSLAILGIPWHDKTGNLDSLLFDSMQVTHADIVPPLNTFCNETAARNGNWGITPKSKMKLRCTIAASYEDDPGLSLGFLLMRDDCPIDLSNAAFDPVADFLTGFIGAVG